MTDTTRSQPADGKHDDDILDVRDLVVEFPTGRKKVFRAVDGVSFSIRRGETVGLVGESGSGKSTIGRAVLGLQDVANGQIRYAGKDVTVRTNRLRRSLSRVLQVIFQDPYSSLNPSRTVGKTLAEPLEVQGGELKRDATKIIDQLLEAVGMPADAANRYPHGFSGGQRQRIAIARSLAISPEVIVADEAVSALDLVTRAQVVNLLQELQSERDFAYLFIAHDLPLVTHMSQRTIVLYRGRVMEQGPAELVEEKPLHPYTQALLASVPVANPTEQRERREARRGAGRTTTANAASAPEVGCPFAPRCPIASQICWEKRPRQVTVDERTLECHAYDPESGHPGTDTTVPVAETQTLPANETEKEMTK